MNPEHSAAFPVRLRVPSWCNKPIVTVNGAAVAAGSIKGWLELNRTWSVGDAVDLTLPMNVRVEVAQNGLASVERGPLVYALAVEGRRWHAVDSWGSFEEFITPESKWNYGVVVDKNNPASSFKFKSLEVPRNACLWDHPRVGAGSRCGSPARLETRQGHRRQHAEPFDRHSRAVAAGPIVQRQA